ncbi:MAG: glucosylceramidase [Spirochaetes bacterium]|nr:glucosylceramidase [Spirochaetota bacterium]
MLDIYETCKKNQHRLTKLKSIEPMQSYQDNQKYSITIDPAKKYQELLGFGGAFTEAAAYTFYRMREDLQEEILSAFFSEKGLAYVMGRTHINSCDFSLNNYDYVEKNDDTLSTFSIDREKKYVIPWIKKAQAQAGVPLKILSSPWSPPGWMKTNHSMNHGGKLLPDYSDIWAQYYCTYIREFAKEKISIWGVTVQNEPEAEQIWDSCLYTAEEERDFVKNHLGPVLKRNDLDNVKIIIHDHNRDRLFERSKTILQDPEAAGLIWGAGFHWYCQGNYQNLDYFNEYFPEKKLIFTEGCQEMGTHHNDYSLGERYGKAMINDLNRNTVAWLDWNLLLDLTGGPNHVYNMCSAPVLVDPKNQKIFYETSYFYIGHFSQFIKPQAKRIFCSVSDGVLLATAFINPDKQLVLVLMNDQAEDKEISINILRKNYQCVLLGNSIRTLLLTEGK